MAYLGRESAKAPLVTADIPDDSITSAKIVADTIAAGDLAPNSVDSSELVDGSVDLSHMSADSVDSNQYVDGSIDTIHVGDNQITLAKMAGGTDGQIITYDASGDPVAVGPGDDGQVLTSTGAGSPPAFEDAGGGSTSASDLDSGTLAVARMASGTTLQTKGDAYTSTGGGVNVTSGSYRVLGTNLEVAINCSSTSNFLRLSCFIPDVSNEGNAIHSLKAGFRYSTDSFSSSDVVLGDSEWISKYDNYHESAEEVQTSVYIETWEQVPVAGSEIKIQLSVQTIGGNVTLAKNFTVAYSLIVSEIKA